MTFSFRPTSVSMAPANAASVSTLVVSWKLAALMKLSLCRLALVMPSSRVLPRSGLGLFGLRWLFTGGSGGLVGFLESRLDNHFTFLELGAADLDDLHAL